MNKTKDIMTKDIITLSPETTMAEAYQLMAQKKIRHLPVVDERMKVIGILSDRDVQRSMTVQKINKFQHAVSIDSTKKVEDFMSWPVYTVSESTSIESVVEEMLVQKISAFVVCDNWDHMKGIVTTDDLLSYLLNVLKEQKQIHQKTIAQYFSERSFA